MIRTAARALALALLLPLAASAQDADEEKTKTDDGLHPRVTMTTTVGDIVLELDADKAPITVYNFIRYADEGYYNGTIFHRVMSNFMIQAGGFTVEMDKKEKGLHPTIKNEWRNGLKNKRGTISMARLGGDPDSASSQFFINVVDNARLDRPQRDGAAYAVFGKVVEGMDVVDKIRNTAVRSHPKYSSPQPVTPIEPIVIKSIKLVGKYDREKAAKVFNAAKAAAGKRTTAREKKLQDFITKTETETGKKFQEAGDGLMFMILKEGDGPSPKSTDTVQVHYTGWLLDGKKFDSSVDRGTPATFPLSGVIRGWTIGVGMMKVGEKRKLLIPPDLGYGARGSGSSIPTNAHLVFDVELLSIQ